MPQNIVIKLCYEFVFSRLTYIMYSHMLYSREVDIKLISVRCTV